MTYGIAEPSSRLRKSRWRGWSMAAVVAAAAFLTIRWQMHRSAVQTALDNHLMDAVLNSDVAGTREALRKGANPSTVGSGAPAPADVWSAVRQMLKGGRDPDSASMTALMYAYSDGDGAIVEVLLGAGADANAEDERGWTALMWACYHRGEAYVPILLRHGADVDHATRDGVTALLIAVSGGHTSIVRMLLNSGASTRVAARNGRLLTRIARPFHSAELDRLLQQHGAP